MGRDRFIEFYKEQGLTLFKTKNFRRTTDSSGVTRFPNLLSGLELTHVNQALVSDITYFDLNGRFVYITFIMDLYSRKIKGYSLAKTLRTQETTIPALKLAMQKVPKNIRAIIHSDGGGQYYSREFMAMTKNRFINSMAESVYENAHAERVNGTIKNDYLIPSGPKDFNHLNKLLSQSVEKYNNHRPHQSLRYLTPTEFERKASSYPQNHAFLTKEKRSKKENNYNYSRIN